MATTTIYRKANVSTADARKSLEGATIPKLGKIEKISSLEVVPADADAARAAHVGVGDLVYEAVVHCADFPPSDDDKSDSGDDAPAPSKEKSDDGGSDDSDSSSDSSDSDSSDGDSKPNPFGDKGGDGDDKGEGKGDVQHQILHVLTELLHAVNGGGGLGAGPDGPDLGGPVPPAPGPGGPLDTPDIGAPPAGGPPLPPPVKEKSPIGGAAFAAYKETGLDENAPEITILRHDASELGNKAMCDEFAVLNNHRVAKIQRTGSARVNGLVVDLPGNDVAVVTLTRG